MICEMCKKGLEKTIKEFTSAKYDDKEIDKIIMGEVKKDMHEFVRDECERIVGRIDKKVRNMKRQIIEEHVLEMMQGVIGEHTAKVRNKAE